MAGPASTGRGMVLAYHRPMVAGLGVGPGGYACLIRITGPATAPTAAAIWRCIAALTAAPCGVFVIPAVFVIAPTSICVGF